MEKRVLANGLVLAIAVILVIVFLYWYSGLLIEPYEEPAHTMSRDFSKALNLQGEIVVSENLEFVKASGYRAETFAAFVNLEENCVEIQASDSDAFSVGEGRLIVINELIQTNVYYRCVPGAIIGNDECPLFCTISFGKELS